MKTIYKLALLACVLLSPCLMKAQTLSEIDKQELQIRTKQKIEDFQLYLSQIGSTTVSKANKDAAVANALELFIGKGKDYWLRVQDPATKTWKEEHHDAVTMQTAGKRSGKRPPIPLVRYLDDLRTQTKYTKLVVDSSDGVRVEGKLRDLGGGRYESVAYYYQKYYGYRDGKLIYNDTTSKKVVIYINLKEVPQPGGNQKIWEVLLGDISVVKVQ